MATERADWQPDWAVAPGEILQEALEERDMSQSELARRMGRPVKTINEIIRGKAAVTPDTALQLELVLGITARFWNNLEVAFREHQARERAVSQLATYTEWAKGFPVKALERHGLIKPTAAGADTVAALLGYFKVSTPAAWEHYWLSQSTSFRQSPAFAASAPAVAAWLRWGELAADALSLEPYNERKFVVVLQEIRGLTRKEPFGLTLQRVQTLCASAGVAVVVTPELPGTHLSGAARWLTSRNAVIQLSLRHKTDDHFWFSFFHEAGHLVGNRHENFVDSMDSNSEERDAAEEAADVFARETLIATDEYLTFTQRGDFSPQAVRDFAKSQGIAAGIVVGRLQRDDHVPRSHLNELRKPIRFAT